MQQPTTPCISRKEPWQPRKWSDMFGYFPNMFGIYPHNCSHFSPRPSALSQIVLFVKFPALRQDPAKLSPSTCFSTFVTSRVIQHDTRLARWETPFFDRKPSRKIVRFHHFNKSKLASPNGNCTRVRLKVRDSSKGNMSTCKRGMVAYASCYDQLKKKKNIMLGIYIYT